MDKIICKKIKNEIECKENKGCIFTKTKKCQQKRQSKKIDKTLKSPTKSPIISATKSSIISAKLISNSKASSESRKIPSYIKPDSLENNPCLGLETIKQQIKETRRLYDENIQACENYHHQEFITKYFNKQTSTHKDLLICLMKYYKEEKNKNALYVFTFQDFINKFPRDKIVGGINFKKQHVFEAICRLLLLYDYDNGELGRNKIFYKSLEDIINGSSSKINDKILGSDINVGSTAGLVDILFKTSIVNTGENDESDKKWGCEIPDNSKKEHKVSDEEDTYIMIQNKYYDIEKSNLSNYDVTRMYTLADLNKKYTNQINGKTEIVLMVNNKDALSQKLKAAKQQYPGLIKATYGITDKLDTWFQAMLYELKNSDSIETFLHNKGHIPKLKPSLKLRFHQLLITRSTMEYFNEGYKKFIWGAVPRSGKSFMIGGLISLRNIKHQLDHNIVLILGAKTETQGQFVDDLFEKYDEFKEYNIVIPGINEIEKEKNIYLFSQEYLKDKINLSVVNKKINQDETIFNDLFKFKKLKSCNKKIDLYFDEIHKGGSTDRSESILYAFKNICKGIKHDRYSIIDLFVMVTATFAKPSIKYEENFIDGKPNSIIIQWSYEDQQHMKDVTNDTKMHMMINSKHGYELKIIKELFEEYKDRYGYSYLSELSKEYKIHPELVLISPFLLPSYNSDNNVLTNTDNVKHVFQNLKCDACVSGKGIEYYKNPQNIFVQEGPVNDLLNYISNSVYNYFQSELKYPISSSHSELWFLPDKDLYGDNDCKDICNVVDTDVNYDTDIKKTKTGIESLKSLPNIEPLSRGLAIKITQNTNFDRYNVLIVHNTKLTYMTKRIKGSDLFGGSDRIKLFEMSAKSDGLSTQIKKFEKATYEKQKSLIILTGAKLRLGISLPCVDIAFNFDNISSVDNNYQTMFRVLTDRSHPTLKKYGYYLDFNKNRAITFLYEYNKNYGAARKSSSIKENVEALQSLLFSFNYNGLNLIKIKTSDTLGLYNQLIDKLQTNDGVGLNEQSYVKYWTTKKNIEGLIKTSLALTGNMSMLNKLSKLLNAKGSILNKPPVRVVLQPGQSQPPMGKYGANDEDPPQEPLPPPPVDNVVDEDVDEDDDDYSDTINKIASELPTIVLLLSLFSDETTPECNNLLDCLILSKKHIQYFTGLCNCSNVNSANILDCYLNSPGNSTYDKERHTYYYRYSQQHLAEILEIIIQILTNHENELLRSNLDFIFNNIKELMSHGDNLIYKMSLNDIEEKIKQYLNVRTEEKNKFGEVFTPLNLINDMLDKIPARVWKNPELTWLDPANGIGNFPMVVYKRLMESLPASYNNNGVKYSDDKGKSKHIINKMLFMVEINSKNVKISKKIFGQSANICCADFLEDENKWKKQFNLETFDIIIGNPPFQDEVKTNDDDPTNKKKKPRQGGKNKLYERITIKCLEILNNNGLLLFVTPDNVMTGNTSEAYKAIVNLNTHVININNIQKTYFPGIGQPMCYFLVEKNKKNVFFETTIINQTNNKFKVNLKDRPVNPIRNWTIETERLIAKYITNTENDFKRTSDNKIPRKDANGTITIIESATSKYKTNDTTAQGYKIPKYILFRMKPTNEGLLDFKGTYGLYAQIYFIPIKGINIKKLQHFFTSNEYRTLVNSATTSQYLKDALVKHINIRLFLSKRYSLKAASSDIYKSNKLNTTKKNVSEPYKQPRRTRRTNSKNSSRTNKNKTKKHYTN